MSRINSDILASGRTGGVLLLSSAESVSGRAGRVLLLSPAESVTGMGELSSKVTSVHSTPLKGGWNGLRLALKRSHFQKVLDMSSTCLLVERCRGRERSNEENPE